MATDLELYKLDRVLLLTQQLRYSFRVRVGKSTGPRVPGQFEHADSRLGTTHFSVSMSSLYFYYLTNPFCHLPRLCLGISQKPSQMERPTLSSSPVELNTLK